MNEEEQEFPIERVLATYIIIMLMYIYTYSNGSILLWAFFVIERCITIGYDAEIDDFFESLDAEDISNGRMLITVIFSFINVGIFIYTPFKYPGLFVILLIGEGIDFVAKRLKRRNQD